MRLDPLLPFGQMSKIVWGRGGGRGWQASLTFLSNVLHTYSNRPVFSISKIFNSCNQAAQCVTMSLHYSVCLFVCPFFLLRSAAKDATLSLILFVHLSVFLQLHEWYAVKWIICNAGWETMLCEWSKSCEAVIFKTECGVWALNLNHEFNFVVVSLNWVNPIILQKDTGTSKTKVACLHQLVQKKFLNLTPISQKNQSPKRKTKALKGAKLKTIR